AFLRLLLLAVKRVFFLTLQGTQQRKENDVADGTRIGQQHGEPIDADAFAGSRRQSVRESTNVVLVHLVSLFVTAHPFAQLLLEAAALLLRIVQLTEGVPDLQAANEDLEALNPLAILLRLALVLGKWRDSERKVINERRLNQMRLGYELEHVRDRLAAWRSWIVGNVRVGRVIAVHHGRDRLRAGEIVHLRLGSSILGPELDDSFAHGEPVEICEINLMPVEVCD